MLLGGAPVFLKTLRGRANTPAADVERETGFFRLTTHGQQRAVVETAEGVEVGDEERVALERGGVVDQLRGFPAHFADGKVIEADGDLGRRRRGAGERGTGEGGGGGGCGGLEEGAAEHGGGRNRGGVEIVLRCEATLEKNLARMPAGLPRPSSGVRNDLPAGRGSPPPSRDRYLANNSATGTIFTAARRMLSGKVLISWSAATTAAGLGAA